MKKNLLNPNLREAAAMAYDEKREHLRYDLNTPIVYAFHDSDEFFKARMCNYCKGGMCFESRDSLDPGSDIYIMMENLAPDSKDAEFYDGYLAEIRWCQKLSRGSAEQYKVGVRYYQTIIK